MPLMRLWGGLPKSFLAMIALTSLGCLQTTIAGVGTGESSGGGSTTGGRSTTGGSTTGPSCAGVYCAAFYACDPSDGLCKCGGEVCGSGNCEAAGACLAGCDVDAGTFTIAGSAGPGSALTLPPASLNVFYSYQFLLACTAPPNVTWTVAASDGGTGCETADCETPPGLMLYSTGAIQGVPQLPGSFNFLVGAAGGFTNGSVFQRVLLTVVRDAGAGQ
jgi:hypothetical protein